MSNIYNRRLDYEVRVGPKGQTQRVLEYPTKIDAPKYAVVGNMKPNLDFYTNRMIQPLFQTKKPLAQPAFTPKQPIHAVGLGGRKPVYIDYLVPPKKPKQAVGLSWEPNSVREQRDNVYPDGVPKNSSQLAQQNASYLEKQYADKEAQRLEGVIKNLVGGDARPLGAREDHPRELEVRRLEKMLEERKYVSNPYKNIALSVEGHRQMAEREAKAIQAELAQLRADAGNHKDDIVDALETKGELASKTPPDKDTLATMDKIKTQIDALYLAKSKLDAKDEEFLRNVKLNTKDGKTEFIKFYKVVFGVDLTEKEIKQYPLKYIRQYMKDVYAGKVVVKPIRKKSI